MTEFFLALDDFNRCYWYCSVVLVYLGGIAEFRVTDKLASINTLCETTTGENIFKEAGKTMIQYNLKWNLLRCVTIDGGRNVCAAEKGFTGNIYKTCENIRCLKLLSFIL